jgi:hypothetical protein
MSRPFSGNPGKRAFGVFLEPQYASDYIYNKKAKTLFCDFNFCKPNTPVDTEGNYLLFQRAAELSKSNLIANINNRNLNINLVTELNLTSLPVILDSTTNQVPAPIDTNNVPYLTYNIDPSGVLFGNTPCGIDNFLEYLQYEVGRPM